MPARNNSAASAAARLRAQLDALEPAELLARLEAAGPRERRALVCAAPYSALARALATRGEAYTPAVRHDDGSTFVFTFGAQLALPRLLDFDVFVCARGVGPGAAPFYADLLHALVAAWRRRPAPLRAHAALPAALRLDVPFEIRRRGGGETRRERTVVRIEAVDCAAPGHALRDCRLAGGVFFRKPGALFAQCVVADADGRFPGDAGYAYVDQRLRLPRG